MNLQVHILTNTHLLLWTFSEDQELRCSRLVDSGSGSCMRAQSRCKWTVARGRGRRESLAGWHGSPSQGSGLEAWFSHGSVFVGDVHDVAAGFPEEEGEMNTTEPFISGLPLLLPQALPSTFMWRGDTSYSPGSFTL